MQKNVDCIERVENKIITVSQLLDINFSEWNCQRFVIEERVEEIQNFILQNKIVLGSITVFCSDQEKIIIDGQHRFFALKGLYCKEEVIESVKNLEVCVQFIWGKDKFQLFKTVNSSCPLDIKDATELSTEIANRIALIYKDKYKKFFSSSNSPKRPNVNINIFSSKVRSIMKIMKSENIGNIDSANVDKICGILDIYNCKLGESIEDMNITSNIKKKAKEGNFFIGLHKEIDTNILKCILGKSVKDENKEEKETKREKITKEIRIKVWEKFYPNVLRGYCLGCNKEISFINFEVSHIESLDKGGDTLLSNLIPLCRECNRDCGTQNALDFINKSREILELTKISL